MAHEVQVFPISENLFFKRSDSPGEGKTKGMAKGLILCDHRNEFAGECAGFGLPVYKIDNLTIFPSLCSSTVNPSGTIDVVYHLNLSDAWFIAGCSTPSYVGTWMEKTVNFYMNQPHLQQPSLSIKHAFFKLFRIRSAMTPGKSYGYCRVRYQAEGHRLGVVVNGSDLLHPGQMILLNEVPGADFSRMISKGTIHDGRRFLPWQPCTTDTAIEHPDRHIGFYLSFPVNHHKKDFQIAAGREVGQDLNWSGLSIATWERSFTYHVNFYDQTN